MADDTTDFHESDRGRRQSWYGTKAAAKRVMSWRVPHLLVRSGASLLGDRVYRERLPAPAHVRQVKATMGGVSFVMNRPGRCIIAKELYWGGGVRPRAEDQLALDVFARLGRDARLVVDVGAYTGIFSLLAARVAPEAQVHAFEVVPEVAKAALDNVVANDLLPQVTVHLEGVGKDGDTARISIGTGGSALPDFYSTQLHFEHGVRVPVRSLDSFSRAGAHAGGDGGGGATVMKIDVEGTEDVVLENGQEFLASNRPDIVCEVLPGVANVDGVRAALAKHGYRYLRFEERWLTAQAELVAHERYRDWLFTTKSDDELAALDVPLSGV